MKRPPTGSTFELSKMTRAIFFQSVLARLNDDVGTILSLIKEHNKTHPRKIGFWASIRMILPIIEAVTYVNGESPQNFLGKYLEINTPHLTWDLFRHSLMHGDYIQHGKFQDKEVSWGVLMFGEGHIIKSGYIAIDIITLYQQLRQYLESEIEKNDTTMINVEVGVIYTKPEKEISEDFTKL